MTLATEFNVARWPGLSWMSVSAPPATVSTNSALRDKEITDGMCVREGQGQGQLLRPLQRGSQERLATGATQLLELWKLLLI